MLYSITAFTARHNDVERSKLRLIVHNAHVIAQFNAHSDQRKPLAPSVAAQRRHPLNRLRASLRILEVQILPDTPLYVRSFDETDQRDARTLLRKPASRHRGREAQMLRRHAQISCSRAAATVWLVSPNKRLTHLGILMELRALTPDETAFLAKCLRLNRAELEAILGRNNYRGASEQLGEHARVHRVEGWTVGQLDLALAHKALA